MSQRVQQIRILFENNPQAAIELIVPVMRAKGYQLTRVAKCLGVAYRTLTRWLVTYPALKEAMDMDKAEFAAGLQSAITEELRVDGATDEPQS